MITHALCIHQTENRCTSVTQIPEAKGGQSVQCIGYTNKRVEDSDLVPNHSAIKIQAGSAHLETSERRAKVKWSGCLIVQHGGK